MRALVDATGGSREWRRRKRACLERDSYVCQLRLRCGGDLATTADHIIPRSQWPAGLPGVDDLSNLQASCWACNMAKGAGVPQTMRAWTW